MEKEDINQGELAWEIRNAWLEWHFNDTLETMVPRDYEMCRYIADWIIKRRERIFKGET